MVLGLKQCAEHVLSGASPRSLVGRAAVHFAHVHRLVDVEGLDDDHRHFSLEDLGQAVLDDEVLPVEARAFDLESGAVRENQRGFLLGLEQVFRCSIHALSDDVVLVERLLLFLTGLLLDRVDLAERVVDFVELDDPRDCVDGAEHLAELLEAHADDVHPRGQVAQRREAPLHPELRDAFLDQTGHGGFDFVGEAGFAFLRHLEQGERHGDRFAEFVDALELLDEAVLEWFAFFAVNADFRELELAAGVVGGLVGRDAFADELDLLVDDRSGAAASASSLFIFSFAGVERQDVEQETEHLVGRQDTRRGFGVRVHADRYRRLLLDALFDVLFVCYEGHELRHFE